MRKSTRIVKRLFALFLVVLMSINTLGAVVSDNDGSAFITKAEFDSLKNDFQSQIDQYNTSIDNKIDGAIASYIGGISLKSEPFVLLEDIKHSIGRDLRFHNSYPTGTNLTTRYIVNKEKSYSLTYKDADAAKVNYVEMINFKSQYANTKYRMFWLTTTQEYCIFVFWYNGKKIQELTVTTGYKTLLIPDNQNTTSKTIRVKATENGLYPTSWDNDYNNFSSTFISNNIYYHVELSNLSPNLIGWDGQYNGHSSERFNDVSIPSSAVGCILQDPSPKNVHYLFQTTWDRAGAGTCWVSDLNPNGNRRLLGYRTNYPLVVLNISSKWWQNKGTVTPANNVFNFTTAHSHSLNLPTSWSYTTSGTHYTSYNTNNNSWWYQLICNLYTETMQRTYVQVDQYGGGTNAVLKYIDLYAQPNYVSETIASNLSYAQSTHTIEGYSASLGAINMTVSPSARGVGLTVDEAPMDYFENIYLSSIAGETVWMGGGAPLMEMQSAKDTEYEVTMKLRLCTGSGGPPESGSTKQAYVMLSKNQFWDGLFRSADDILFDDTVTFDSNGNATLVIDNLTGVDKRKKVWYNLRAYTNGYYVECTECKVKVK